jgi:hypothetical protein
MEANVLIGLEHGFDVILEGILNVQKPGRREFFERIFAKHPEENYIFYMNTSFNETVKRHGTRPDKKDMFEAEAMRGWYDLATPMNHKKEVVIPESSTLEQTIHLITQTSSLNLVKS